MSNKQKKTTHDFLHKKHENEFLLDILSEFVSPYESQKRESNFDEVSSISNYVSCSNTLKYLQLCKLFFRLTETVQMCSVQLED